MVDESVPKVTGLGLHNLCSDSSMVDEYGVRNKCQLANNAAFRFLYGRWIRGILSPVVYFTSGCSDSSMVDRIQVTLSKVMVYCCSDSSMVDEYTFGWLKANSLTRSDSSMVDRYAAFGAHFQERVVQIPLWSMNTLYGFIKEQSWSVQIPHGRWMPGHYSA